MEHSFDIEIAKEYGIHCAILLKSIYFWVKKSKANEQNLFDGRYWTYNSKKAFTKLFPYMSERQIDYALKQLIEKGLILTGNYNKNTYDRTLWYALTDKAFCILHDCDMHFTKLLNATNNFVGPIPDINNSYLQSSDINTLQDTNNKDNLDKCELVKKEANSTKSSVLGKINISFNKTPETKRAEPKTKQEMMILNLQKELEYLNKSKETKDLLKQWIAVIVKNKGGIQIEQIKLALTNLEKLSEKDEEFEREIIKKATMLGYIDFSWVNIEKKQKNPFIHNPNKVDSEEEIYRKQQNNEYIDWSEREFYDDGTPVKKY